MFAFFGNAKMTFSLRIPLAYACLNLVCFVIYEYIACNDSKPCLILRYFLSEQGLKFDYFC